MTNPETTQKGRPALSEPLRVRVTARSYERLRRLEDALDIRQLELTRIALAIGLDALERALAGPDAGRVIAAIRADGEL